MSAGSSRRNVGRAAPSSVGASAESRLLEERLHPFFYFTFVIPRGLYVNSIFRQPKLAAPARHLRRSLQRQRAVFFICFANEIIHVIASRQLFYVAVTLSSDVVKYKAVIVVFIDVRCNKFLFSQPRISLGKLSHETTTIIIWHYASKSEYIVQCRFKFL